MSVVNRGDLYVLKVSATVSAVMDRLGHANLYRFQLHGNLKSAKRVDGPTDDGRPQGSRALRKEACCACSYRIHE
jgi:hypothetical protein